MATPYQRLKRETRGQAAVETALLLPFLLSLAFNVVNFGYFFIVAVNLAAAPRSGVEYSILGGATPGDLKLPAPGPTTTTTSVSYLTLNDLTGAISSGGSAEVQVCTAQAGTTGSGTSQKSVCNQYNSSPTYTVSADPEAPAFILNRVDVTYTFHPLIDQRLFNLILPSSLCSGSPVTCTFHRQVSMRSMN
ncbi:MAG TPA: TadE/TadG family type IV pilus assembly protein [Terriglobia bacterium]|nr:TadE/TadG family type IV pilus assembly protein [Terriglobia bacterium]